MSFKNGLDLLRVRLTVEQRDLEAAEVAPARQVLSAQRRGDVVTHERAERSSSMRSMKSCQAKL